MQRNLRVRTGRRAEVVDITREVKAAVADAGVTEGICTVFVRHSTAAIIINENADPGFRADEPRRGATPPFRTSPQDRIAPAQPALEFGYLQRSAWRSA